MTFNELRKNLKKNFTGYKNIKVALLGDSSTQLLTQAIRGYGYEDKLDLNILESDYNQIERQIMDVSSELYVFKPDFTVVFEAGHKLLQKFNIANEFERLNFAENHINRIKQLICILQKNSKSKIIWLNYAEEDDGVFGSYANSAQSSFIFQQRKLNYLLTEYTAKSTDLFICDISTIQNRIGQDLIFSSSIYIGSDLVISIDALPLVANSIVKIIAAIQGKIKKCIILDLDNTIWGGIIGDDGITNIQIGSLGIGKAFTEFQYWIKKLKQRGIIVCICSKNTASVAKEPFEKHPDMILRLSDIAVFVANWETKVDNIKYIKQVLNIGYDSIVFIDDNPFERDIVRQNIPGITVPELPPDPAEYLKFLYSLNLFETASYSIEDAKRTEQYQKESERNAVRASFTNESDFLKSLNMVSKVQSFDSFLIPRVAQLSQRTNQFNLRTIRYTEDDIKLIAASKKHFTFSFTLEDKYSENGLICAIILEEKFPNELFIDTWFMSCRVLKRGLENFALNNIVNFALNNRYQAIVGEYIPTEKNDLVKEHYANLGFIKQDNFWYLNVDNYQAKDCFITIKKE